MSNDSDDKLTQRATTAVGLCAAALNFSALTNLALGAGYSVWLAWCYPVIVDAYGLTALRAWLRAAHGDRVQRWAKVSSVFALLLSMGAAGLHVFAEGGALPTWAAFTVSTLPALMLGLSVHLLVLVRAEARPVGPEAVPGVIRTDAAATAADPVPALEPPTSAPRSMQPTPSSAAAPAELAEAPVPPPSQLVLAASPRPRRATTKRAAARSFYDAEIGPDDRRGSSALGALLASQFGVHEATGRQWVTAFRREDAAAGLEAVS